MVERSLRNLNEEIKRKYEDYLDIAKGMGKDEGSKHINLPHEVGKCSRQPSSAATLPPVSCVTWAIRSQLAPPPRHLLPASAGFAILRRPVCLGDNRSAANSCCVTAGFPRLGSNYRVAQG